MLGKWAEDLWQSYKLTHEVYDEYLYKTRDRVAARKRNLESVREKEMETRQEAEVQAVTKRVRGNPLIFRPFAEVPAASAWLRGFQEDALRYPILVVLGASMSGKTEWAKSLFRNPLEMKIGGLTYFPDAMRTFTRGTHDGIVLDDVRDLAFLADNQDKLQGKYDAMVEFGSTPGGTCAYKKYLYQVPFVVTINYSTANLEHLETHDWLKNPGNRVVVKFPVVLC